ncbi:MAG: DUF4344 domain-containing metallopeptidase [Cyanobacteria bacterium P01_E01_bin.42]
MNHFRKLCQQHAKYLGKSLFSLALLVGLSSCTADELFKAISTSTKIEDNGDIKIFYEKTDDKIFQEIREVLVETNFFTNLADGLNMALAFPINVMVFFDTCGEANAYYYPDVAEIVMCYELIDSFLTIVEEEIETDEDFEDEVIDTSLFTFFHELGHALVDLYGLPITGKEEDAVDGFATLVLLDVYDDDIGALSGMFQFHAEAQKEKQTLESFPFWDEHSLSSQRFYDIACLIYGSDPNEFNFLIEEDYLPEERAVRCEEEYEQKSNAWKILIEPFLKLE